MMVRVLRSFAGRLPDGEPVRAAQGEIIELPAGVDWLKAGLVEPVADEPKRQAVSRQAGKRETRK